MSIAEGSRELVLGAVRRALGGKAGAPHPPALPADHPGKGGRRFDRGHFVACLREQSCIVAETDRIEQVPALAAGHLRAAGLPLAAAVEPGVLAQLDWKGAGIDAASSWDENLRAAVTLCRAGIAESGQLVVDSATEANMLSLLPQWHVAVIEAHSIRSSLDDLAEIIGAEPPGVVTLIAGPSRTGDIEQQLVIGAHGPQSVLAVIVGG